MVVSGDRASLEADGTLRLFGRDSLVVNTGGEKVFVEEVEAVLRAQPGVADALVVGRDSERWGQEIVALVETHAGAHARPGRAGRPLAPRTWRGSRRPRSSSSSTRSAASATARPTTAGRRARAAAASGSMEHDDSERAIDCLVNVHFGETAKQPEFMLKVRDDYFKGPKSLYDQVELPQLLDEMDEHGVAKAILMDNLVKPSVTARKFVEERPDRFASGGRRHQPAASGACAARTGGGARRPAGGVCRCRTELLGRRACIRPSDAVYYPLYAKCAELELPLCINTGLPGPPIPGEVQNPIHLDRVCVRFPELKLCMIHGADPWWDVAIRLLIKYQNLRIMTSAWSPKRLPDSLLHYMRTRGKNKVIFASDWPVLRQSRVVPEALALDLPPDVLDNYLYNNAEEFFFGQGREAWQANDGPLRTAQGRLQPVRRPDRPAVGLPEVLQGQLLDRGGPGGRGHRIRQEPVGTAVRHRCNHDGAAGVGRRRRRDAGRPDAASPRNSAGASRRCRGSTTCAPRGCWPDWVRWTESGSIVTGEQIAGTGRAGRRARPVPG